MKRSVMVLVFFMNLLCGLSLSGCSTTGWVIGNYDFPDPEVHAWGGEEGRRHCTIMPCANYHNR